MRKLLFLRRLLDLFFIILILTTTATVLLSGVFLFTDSGTALPDFITVNGASLSKLDFGAKSLLITGTVAYLLFLYAVFLLKKITRQFSRTILFEHTVIKQLNHVGYSFIGIAVLMYIPSFIYRLTEHEITVRFDFFGHLFDSFLFIVSLGLFFMVLSSIFKIAKLAKEENDLTV